jgi:hypothetical protein
MTGRSRRNTVFAERSHEPRPNVTVERAPNATLPPAYDSHADDNS